MLIKALCDYAAEKEKNSDVSEKIPEGFSEQAVSYRILLSRDGRISSIYDMRKEEISYDKKGKEKKTYSPRNVRLPVRTQKTAIDSNIIEHRPAYIFGLGFLKDEFTSEDSKAKKSHYAFVKKNLEFFDGLESDCCIAYRNFIKNWDPESETKNPFLLNIGRNYKNSYFCFGLEGMNGNLEEDPVFLVKYNEYLKENDGSGDEISGWCCIKGERLPIARIHDKIKFPGGISSGCTLVGMNSSAYESYGKTQSFNSNISEYAMKQYTSALNGILSDKGHYTIIDDLVIIYFAMKADDTNECSFILSVLNDSDTASTDQTLKSAGDNAEQGKTVNYDAAYDDDVTFYIAGLTPNSSRICQKFIYRDTFGNIRKNLEKHQSDLCISETNKKEISFYNIKRQLVSPKSNKDKVPPPLMSDIIMAALQGSKYPRALLETVVRRVKTDSDEENKPYIKLNRTRAGIIKACINRNQNKEEIKMSVDKDNLHPAYLCGRLFAVYEEIQQASVKNSLNRTIRDSYFSSACSRPNIIMPKLAKLSQYHMKKLEKEKDGVSIADRLDKLAHEIMGKFENNEFPGILGLEDQGRFIIGYYQQSNELYPLRKKEKEGN